MAQVKELEMNVQYVMNVLSSKGQQTASEALEYVLETLGYKPSENVRDGAVLIPVPELGDTLLTVGQVRLIMEDLDDHDIVYVEACDEEGDMEDLYPMSMDIIEGIELTNGKTVREVRFCQRPHENVQTEDYRIGFNFTKVYNKLLETNKKTHIAHGMGYTTTTQLDNVLSGSSCISTSAVMNLVKVYNVNPTYLYTGIGNLFN